jgi:hypothetical protein
MRVTTFFILSIFLFSAATAKAITALPSKAFTYSSILPVSNKYEQIVLEEETPLVNEYIKNNEFIYIDFHLSFPTSGLKLRFNYLTAIVPPSYFNIPERPPQKSYS